MKLFKRVARTRGIGLTESIVYLACSVFFISLAGKLLFVSQRAVQQEAAKAERWVELAVAMDCVCRTFKEAARDKIFWKVMKSDCAIFRSRDGDRGIMIEKGRLVVVRGMYSLNGFWLHRSQSVLLENAVLNIAYEIYDGRVIGVSIIIGAGRGIHLETFMGLV